MSKKSTSITMDEMYAELDKHRYFTIKTITLNKEQKEFLRACQDPKKGGVPWETVATLWSKKWQKIGKDSLRRLYQKYIREQNES